MKQVTVFGLFCLLLILVTQNGCTKNNVGRVQKGGLSDGLVAYWCFNNPLNPGHDNSGHGHTLTIPGRWESVKGAIDNGIRFDKYAGGTNRGSRPLGPYTSTSDMRYPGAQGFTSSFWLKPQRGVRTTIQDYWQHRAGGETNVLGYGATGDNFCFFIRDDYDSNPAPIDLLAGASRNIWVHVAGVYEPADKSIRLYVDGELKAEEHLPKPMRSSIPPYFYVAGNWHGTFGGTVDEVRLYNRALNADEISQLGRRELDI